MIATTVFHGDLNPTDSCTHHPKIMFIFEPLDSKMNVHIWSFGRKILAFHQNVRSFEFFTTKASNPSILTQITRWQF
jgi:hypothetical protein